MVIDDIIKYLTLLFLLTSHFLFILSYFCHLTNISITSKVPFFFYLSLLFFHIFPFTFLQFPVIIIPSQLFPAFCSLFAFPGRLYFSLDLLPSFSWINHIKCDLTFVHRPTSLFNSRALPWTSTCAWRSIYGVSSSCPSQFSAKCPIR